MRDRLLLQDRVQACITGSADGKTGAVAKDGSMAVFRVKLEPGKAVDVQDVRAVDADKLRRVENSFHITQRLLLEIPLSLGAKTHIIVLRFETSLALEKIRQPHFHILES